MQLEVQNINMEVERNKKVLNYLIKNPVDLAKILDNLEHAEFVSSEDRIMVERFRQMIANGVSYEAIINMIKEFGIHTPRFFALFVSLAVYRFYNG
ncbi:hypothetical protein J4450_07765 [Candidatus Micrarchaeota archaeon]|nr:hypothetical protein [Candidatus Micrarchaeota archaeon]